VVVADEEEGRHAMTVGGPVRLLSSTHLIAHPCRKAPTLARDAVFRAVRPQPLGCVQAQQGLTRKPLLSPHMAIQCAKYIHRGTRRDCRSRTRITKLSCQWTDFQSGLLKAPSDALCRPTETRAFPGVMRLDCGVLGAFPDGLDRCWWVDRLLAGYLIARMR
jgi:hypothetical protein